MAVGGPRCLSVQAGLFKDAVHSYRAACLEVACKDSKCSSCWYEAAPCRESKREKKAEEQAQVERSVGED